MALLFISFAYIMAYNCCEISRNFRGSSGLVRMLIGLIGNICHIASYALFIWSFWHYDWWMPIVAYLGSIIFAGFTALIFQRTLIGMMLSPVLLLLFTILSVIYLLN